MKFLEGVTTIFIICLSVAGYMLEMEGITLGGSQNQQVVFGVPATYVSIGVIINGIVVLYLLILLFMNTKKLSFFSILIGFLLLVITFSFEVLMATTNVKLPSSVVTYVMVTVSFLIRMYYILDFHCFGSILPQPTPSFSSAPKKPVPTTPSIVKQVTEPAKKPWEEMTKEERQAERTRQAEEFAKLSPEKQAEILAKRAARKAEKESQ